MAETSVLTREHRLDMAELAWKEGRIIQGKWRRPGENGREMVCALAAFGPDINGSNDCPADLMPRWLAELVPTLDDGIALKDVPWFAGELIARARRWHVLDDAAWDRIRTGYLIAMIKQSVASAEKVVTDPAPKYWQPVVDACNQAVIALQTGKGLLEAKKAADAAAYAARAAADAAAYAARAAADAAADAARAAADAAADAAAYAAAYAARAAADAAADAAAYAAAYAARAAADAAADAAAYAARAAADAAAYAAAYAAYKSLAELLFQIIDAELDA